MATNNPVLKATGDHARACRNGDPAQIATARMALTEAKLVRAVNEALAAAPPLSPEQRERVAGLLTAGAK